MGRSIEERWGEGWGGGGGGGWTCCPSGVYLYTQLFKDHRITIKVAQVYGRYLL